MAAFLQAIPAHELDDLLIVSQVELRQGDGGVKGEFEGLGVAVSRAEGEKCLRCWKYTGDVGSHPCARGPVRPLCRHFGRMTI